MHVDKYRVQLCDHSGSEVDFHFLFPSIVTNCRGAMYLLHTAVRRTTSCPPKVTLSCNSCKCMRVNGRALQLHAVYKKPFCYYKSPENPYQYCSTHENPYQCYKSHENPYQVLHVTQTMSEDAMKLMVHMIIIIIIVYWKKLSPFVAVGVVTHAAHS